MLFRSLGPGGLWASRMHGADFALDLNRTQTRVQVEVQNRSGEALEVRMGPEGAVTMNAIGEVLLRQIDGPPGGPPVIPYNSMQAVSVEAGWKGTFYLDAPLGRETLLGQYFVLILEARNGKGGVERRTLPLIATNAGSGTPDAR